MIEWDSSNLSESETTQFNSVINSDNANAIAYAVESLSNRYRSTEGYEAPLVTGKKASNSKKVFRSQAELSRAIADPRYSSDPAFRMDVEEKLARSGDLL
jgi:predicted negative regulator of RcsB-dependent stress response